RSFQSNDWRYSITDNGNGTYTVSYTANQYEYNPPLGSVGFSFNVNGNTAPDIQVLSYTTYNQ
ncbi:MAG: hypothetical protein IKT14_04785, partial [Clostridiales bacterium]|nr:hypothetical protein [Clostridiales bacterium]